jgi:hypothetical protein
MGRTGPGGPGATRGEALRRSPTSAEARADGRRGLAPHAYTYGGLDAPAESGPEHAGPGFGGDAQWLLVYFIFLVPSRTCITKVNFAKGG